MGENTQKAIRLQAAAVQANADKIRQAEALEAAARQLRKDAAKPAAFDFSAIKKDKEARIDAFNAAIKADAIKRTIQAVTAAGWKKQMGRLVFTMEGRPGLEMKVAGGSFSVHQSGGPVVENMELRNLEQYLKTAPKPIKKNK